MKTVTNNRALHQIRTSIVNVMTTVEKEGLKAGRLHLSSQIKELEKWLTDNGKNASGFIVSCGLSDVKATSKETFNAKLDNAYNKCTSLMDNIKQ